MKTWDLTGRYLILFLLGKLFRNIRPVRRNTVRQTH